MKRSRSAFTLIEILVSVMLIAIVVMGILKIREQNVRAARYLEEQIEGAWANSLFLGDEIARFDGKRVDALTPLTSMNIQKRTSREILHSIEREIELGPPLQIPGLSFPVMLRSIYLRGEHSAKFFRIF
ncbi:type II secretion system protein [Nitratifractor sp.]